MNVYFFDKANEIFYFCPKKMRYLFGFICFPLFLHFSNAQTKIPRKIKLPPELREVSGLYDAAPDSLWWHNDSGDQPRLVLTDAKGHLKKQIFLKAQNKDWEDITADNQGNIYIGDFGNNQNKRTDLRIYIYRPDTETLDSILFNYPDQQAFPPAPAQCNFNMEAFFWQQDTLHLFSKNQLLKGNYYTKHYTLPARAGAFTATLQDSIYLKKRVVTAAAVSKDGQTMVLLAYFYKIYLHLLPITHTTLYTFQKEEGKPFLQGEMRKKRVGKFLIPTQYECLDFIDPETVYIASERTPLFKQQAKRVKLKGVKKKVIKP